MRRATLRAGVVIAAFALPGCLGAPIDPADELPEGHDEHHETPTTPAEELGPADVVFDVLAGMPDAELRFRPDTLDVARGAIVELRVTNAGVLQHTLTIRRFGADTNVLEPGEGRALKFRADEAGSFEIVCVVPGHYESGMKGTLEVAP